MEGTEIDLIQMLDCRERRGFIQNELLGKYHCPVISFCMNIPGPIKTNPQIREAFLTGLAALTTALEEASITVLQSYDIAELTGDEWIAAVDADSAKVKELSGKQAQECARMRAHSVPQMQEAVMKMLAK